MLVLFIHGWSVTNTDTYGDLPEALARRAAGVGLDLNIVNIHLGRYVSFHDEVTMGDLVRGLDQALRDQIGDDAGELPAFSCITHSTGGPVVREWVDHFYGPNGLDRLPLRHLVMLAPANHGSPLAALGKARVGRMKAWFNGIEPGVRILDWLSLGSEGERRLNRAFVDYRYEGTGFYPFVLVGQTIDESWYDFINPYLVEVGSDGVVRVCGANANCGFIRLRQNPDPATAWPDRRATTYRLDADGGVVRQPAPVPLGVIADASHSGKKIGIMRSVVGPAGAEKPVVGEILKCFQVDSADAFETRRRDLAALTTKTQADDTKLEGKRYVGLVFSVVDDRGEAVEDFDLLLLAGNKYDPGKLPKGFFVDRQRNAKSPNTLVYYVNYNAMRTILHGKMGLRVVPRPGEGFSHYEPAEFRSDGVPLDDLLRPNETLYIEIVVHRHVDKNVFRFDPVSSKPNNFKNIKPLGQDVTDR